MRICIIGGGNIGTAMAVIIAAREKAEVVMHTSKVESWHRGLDMIDSVTGERTHATLTDVTSDYRQAVQDCDIVLITHPSFMLETTIWEIGGFLKDGAMVGFIPGTGGVEFLAKPLLQSGHVVFGVDRVPCISRVSKYGEEVFASPKKSVRLCAIPGNETAHVCTIFSELFGLECIPIKTYLTITFTPSNPILHTARLYTMFHEDPWKTWDSMPLFYHHWDNAASEMLLTCDSELQTLCTHLSGLPLEVIPLNIHYESETVPALTQKMQSISSLKNIESPMKRMEHGFTIDLSSRYFIEDIPFGLCILRGFSEICGVPTPRINLILRWYEQIAHVRYFSGTEFIGPDLAKTTIPQNFGIQSIDDIYCFYQK